MEHHRDELERMGVKLLESTLMPNYYDEGEAALYQVYQIENND